MELMQIRVPDIGDFKEVEVIEVMVAEGDTIEADQSLITVESDKASMEIPSSHAGVVESLGVKVGDKIAEGAVLLMLRPSGAAVQAEEAAPRDAPPETSCEPGPRAKPGAPTLAADEAPGATSAARPAESQARAAIPVAQLAESQAPAAAPTTAVPRRPAEQGGVHAADGDAASQSTVHASPSIRQYARELGVDLMRVPGTGAKGRIQRADVQQHVKSALAGGGTAAGGKGGTGLNLLPWPAVDFSKFGPVDVQPLSRIKKISGANLHRNWVMIPHVTQYDEADVTELEAFRKQVNAQGGADAKLTLLAFAVKASVAALKQFPSFNASLGEDGESLILKHYYHIGFAADTPHGLVVPVIKDADQRGVMLIAQEMAQLSAQAREGKLKPADMQGATFTISSLGGIGGLGFTPIINAPEVAILGLSRTALRPVWDGEQFVPRLMMPMSLSYDHRVVDGALGARFSVYLSAALTDLRRALL